LTTYIDTHCHLDLPHFNEDRAAVIDRAIQSGVDRMINPGLDLTSSRRIFALSKQFPSIKPAVGIHPNDIQSNFESDITELRSMLRSEYVVAIGEIGLDEYHHLVPIELQIRCLMEQLDLANEFRKPVIIHSRESLPRITPILEAWSEARKSEGVQVPYGVMHSFEGNVWEAMQFIEMGFFISLAGPVTYKNAYTKIELAEKLPLDALLLETDSPYLTPVPHRGKRNEPSYLPLIGQRTAIIRECSEELIMEITTRNAFELFLLE
jgi:TatD DNase family protein